MPFTVDNFNLGGTEVFATTDLYEVQRSLDEGETWTDVRHLAGPLTGTMTLYDYEAPNGVETLYRARALHNYSGIYAASAWVEADATWVHDSWRLKHPNIPALNMEVTVRSFESVSRAGRTGSFQPLGSATAVVVSDTRGPVTGNITFRLYTLLEQEALDALLDTTATLLLQAPVGDGGPDYIKFSNHERKRILPWAKSAARTFDSLEFVAVTIPPGDVVAWS